MRLFCRAEFIQTLFAVHFFPWSARDVDFRKQWTLFTVSILLKDSMENWDLNSHQKSLSCCSCVAVVQDRSGLAGLATAVNVIQPSSFKSKITEIGPFSTHFSVALRKAATKMLVYRVQFATLYGWCLVVSSYRTQAARCYTTLQSFFSPWHWRSSGAS